MLAASNHRSLHTDLVCRKAIITTGVDIFPEPQFPYFNADVER